MDLGHDLGSNPFGGEEKPWRKIKRVTKSPSVQKHRKILRQCYIDTDATVSSLSFHPTELTFAASCFDGNINLYRINPDEIDSTSIHHQLHHPNYVELVAETERLIDSHKQSLDDLVQSNEAKQQRLRELQQRN